MSDHDDGGVPRHPIGVVSERTGLSVDVLRVWERRYGVVRPLGDGGGQRLYTDEQVERLRLLQRSTEGGKGDRTGRAALPGRAAYAGGAPGWVRTTAPKGSSVTRCRRTM